MPVATYTTINGMLVHESRGGVESFYFPDTLGSLTTVRSATGVKTYGAEYWPYGEIQTETGTNPSPWSFVGLLGYLRDTASRLYVRARHYRPGLARWQTVDPLWPEESAYGYPSDPVTDTDASGLGPGDWFQWIIDNLSRPNCVKDPRVKIVEPFLPEEAPGSYVLPYPYFDPSKDPRKWGYANWCGMPRPGEGNKEGTAIDALDRCCEAHDHNLGPNEFNGPHGCAHCELATCASKADCSWSPTPRTCNAARLQLRKMFEALCAIEKQKNKKCRSRY